MSPRAPMPHEGVANFSGGDGGIWVRRVFAFPEHGCPMKPTITIEIPADSETLVRRLLALHDELSQLALTAPDGTVFDACEAAVVTKGRDLNAQILADA